MLSTEGDQGHIAAQSLRAIALGRTRFGEIRDAVRTDPTRTLERLVALRLVERVVAVTEDERRTRRAVYRIADNFLAFWLRLVEPLRGAIDHGMGAGVLPVLESSLDDFMGPRWDDAFRAHLRRRAAGDELLKQEIVAIGPWWRDQPAVEIDAVPLAGPSCQPVLVGEAKGRGRSTRGASASRWPRRRARCRTLQTTTPASCVRATRSSTARGVTPLPAAKSSAEHRTRCRCCGDCTRPA
jgi:uncharacterized protein